MQSQQIKDKNYSNEIGETSLASKEGTQLSPHSLDNIENIPSENDALDNTFSNDANDFDTMSKVPYYVADIGPEMTADNES